MNGHVLVSKQGENYELDRSAWITYANFSHVYEQIGEELVEAGVAKYREEPAWMNIGGLVVEEKDAYGYNVMLDITELDQVRVMYEVGRNTNQKGDGSVGGELQLYERGKIPRRKVKTKDKHYTVLGLTSISGKTVMCIVISAGETPRTITETGLELDAETYGDLINVDFIEQNSGPGRRLPGSPTYNFDGVDVPCL